MDIVFSGVRFSVVVPLYNRPEEIEELLASLVEQTFQEFQFIVVEDGSNRDARDSTIGEVRQVPRANPQPIV